VAELLQTARHTTPITYEHFKRLPAIAADSRKRKEQRTAELVKKGPGKQGGHRSWEDLLKTKHGNDPEKLSWLETMAPGDRKKKKIGNEDMHRGDAPLTSHEVEKIRDRLNMWVGKVEQRHHEGAADAGQLGALHEAVQSLNHPGLDRDGLKSLMEGLRCVFQVFKLRMAVPTIRRTQATCLMLRCVCALLRDKMQQAKTQHAPFLGQHSEQTDQEETG
jgi:hypothetical protein